MRSKPKTTLHPELNDAISCRSLALFIGADLPREVTGLPSRADLARELARRKGLDTSLSLAEVAQRVARGGNRWEFTSFIRDQLDTTGKPPQPFHRRIVEWVQEQGIKTLITTAYDSLLELTFQEAGVPINRLVRGSDVSFIAPDRPTLIKLYGDAQQPDTLVVTEDDHYGLWRDRDKEDLLHEVRVAMRRQTVLFLGYNLADPDFNLLWREVLDRAGRFARTAYAVWPGLPEGEVGMWRDRGITILNIGPLPFLESIAVSISGKENDLVASTTRVIEHPTASEVRKFLEKDILRLENALHDVWVSVSGQSPLVKYSITSNWKSISARFPDISTEMESVFDEIVKTRELARGGPQKLSKRQLSSAKQGVVQILTYLQHQFPTAGVEAIPSPLKGEGRFPDRQPALGTGIPWAVLVGVNEYEDSANYGQLQVCVKDVEAIREQLVAGGFDPARIRLLTDHTEEPPTRANILAALKAVADATEPDDLLLFYYSGHGEEDGGESYLVARDGRRLVLSDTAVSLSRVKEIVEEAPARAKVIVLDACHSGADIGGKGPKPMSEAFIRHVFEQAEGLAILASCKQGQLSYEWRENERSVFTHFLLEALVGTADRDEKGFVTVQDASRHVTNGVKLWASQRNTSQIPTLQYTVAGDIILVRHQ